MANYGSTPEKTTEEYYGNPTYNGSVGAGRTDEFGNAVQQGRTDTGYGTADAKTGDEGIVGHHGGPAVLQRSGSSSSSSEDDGLGGRRKKGLKEKIKEKLPGGGNKNDQYSDGTQTTTPYGVGTTYTGEGEQQQKGTMDKIKEKLPGGKKGEQYSHDTSTTAAPYGGTGHTEEPQEKKGIMDKIKEKLPGGRTE